jgi:hypothetical protein
MRSLRRLACLVVLALPFAGACRSTETPTSSATPSASVMGAAPAATPSSAPPTPPAADTKRFGEPVAPGDALPLARVLGAPDDFASRVVTVEGKVRRNCTRRGCWMELATSLDPTLPGCRVTFKDYGFFVPLDSAGSSARVQGTVLVQTVEAPEVAHLESEGARFASKQPDGTAREVRMVASGVELWRDKT